MTANRFSFSLSAAAIILFGLAQTGSVGLAAEPEQIPLTAKYIVFLHLHAAWAQQDLAAKPSERGASDRAVRMGLEAADLTILTQAAVGFVSQEQLLREEARGYHRETRAQGGAPDPATVGLFSDRRDALASAAFADMKARLTPEKYALFHEFVERILGQSIRRF